MKQQARNVSPWKLGVLSVLSALLVIVFACSEELDTNSQETSSQSSEVNVEVFTLVEEQPEFKGGIGAFYKYVGDEIIYPLQARQKGVQGQVDVQFVVERDGSLSDVKAIKEIGAGCDSEAVRVVQNAPSFKPGKQRGRPVRTRMVIPIIFKLNEGKTNEDNSTQGIIVIKDIELKNNKLKVDANYAQGAWSGTVYDDAEGTELPGANIVVTGTSTGTVSDLDGTFKIKADQSKDLHVSFVGYQSVKVEGK